MTFSRRSLPGWTLAGLLALTLGAGQARAGFTITLDAGSPTGSGPFTYAYTATIPLGDQINAGDFFRIYDFLGYVPGSIVAPAGWTASVANSSPTPPPNVILTHGDDPAIPNLIWTYNGAAPIVGPFTTDGFMAQSAFDALGAIKDFVGRDTKSTGPTAGSPVDSIGDVRVPGVPEPSSLVSASLGVLVAGAVFGYRSRRKIHRVG